MTTSRWRLRARQVIRRTLDALPADADEQTRRRALRDAYPFGQREHHPYKCWLAEVRVALQSGPVRTDPDSCRIRPVAHWLGRDEGLRLLHLSLRCGLCSGSVPGGCLVCLLQVQTLYRLIAHPRWLAWQKSVADDPTALGPLSDWLEEEGFGFWSESVRQLMETQQ